MSHDIRRLVNQTNSQVRRAPGAKQHEMVRIENHMGGKVLMDVTPLSKHSTPAGGARADTLSYITDNVRALRALPFTSPESPNTCW